MSASVSTHLAFAARRVRALAARVPEADRPDIASSWDALIDAMEGQPDQRAMRLVDGWLSEMETQLTRVLLNAPLEIGGSS